MRSRLIAFLEKLRGESIDPSGRIAVSSIQRAQIISWLNANGVAADFNQFKANLISVTELLGGTPSNVETPSAAATAAANSVPPMRAVAPPQSNSQAVLLGIGIDIQAKSKMPETKDYRTDPFYKRNFTDRELAHCIEKADPLESFAGIWAAKEAILKAGAASRADSGELASIEVIYSESGAPTHPGCLLSISHEADLAVAVCVRCG